MTASQQPSFASARKGYDRTEVDTYLEALRDDIARLSEDLTDTSDQLTATSEELSTTRDDLEQLQANVDEAKKKAREEADEIISSARQHAAETVATAERDAAEIRDRGIAEEEEMRERLRTRENEITTELDEIDKKVGDRNQTIEELEERLVAEEARYGERVDTLRNVAAGLEDALRSIVDGSLVELGVFLETQRAAVADNDIVGAAVHHHFTTDALLAASPAPVEETAREARSPSPHRVEPEVDVVYRRPQTEGDQDDDETGERRSYYSRRSAKLPHMGNGQGQSILAAMSAMRPEHHEPDDDSPDEA